MGYLKKALNEEILEELKSVSKTNVPKCDFCADPNPVYVYAASRMSTGLNQTCWRWCACYSCSRSVDNNEWNELEDNLIIPLRDVFPVMPLHLLYRAARISLKEFVDYSIKS